MAHLRNKIKRELLINGYLREQEKTLKLYAIIPAPIYKIIFEFQRLLEIWNKKLSHKDFKITNDGENAKLVGIQNWTNKTIYGDHVVKYGDNFVWNIKLNKGNDCVLVVGLIQNNFQLMQQQKTSSNWYRSDGYALGCQGGFFGFGSCIRKYCDKKILVNQGDVMEMRFNWKKSSFHFIANGMDLGNALSNPDGSVNKVTDDEKVEFRFALTVQKGENMEIMIQGQEM